MPVGRPGHEAIATLIRGVDDAVDQLGLLRCELALGEEPLGRQQRKRPGRLLTPKLHPERPPPRSQPRERARNAFYDPNNLQDLGFLETFRVQTNEIVHFGHAGSVFPPEVARIPSKKRYGRPDFFMWATLPTMRTKRPRFWSWPNKIASMV